MLTNVMVVKRQAQEMWCCGECYSKKEQSKKEALVAALVVEVTINSLAQRLEE
jgi:ribosomal protein L37AE/L43A